MSDERDWNAEVGDYACPRGTCGTMRMCVCALAEDMVEELARLRALTEWRDISSAPRDGTWLEFAMTDERREYGRWDADTEAWVDRQGWGIEAMLNPKTGEWRVRPYAWRPVLPLPQPPEDA